MNESCKKAGITNEDNLREICIKDVDIIDFNFIKKLNPTDLQVEKLTTYISMNKYGVELSQENWERINKLSRKACAYHGGVNRTTATYSDLISALISRDGYTLEQFEKMHIETLCEMVTYCNY